MRKLEPFGEGDNGHDDLTIRVEEADGHLMYRRADNIGLTGGTSFGLPDTESRENQVMRKGEYLFTVNKRGVIINQLGWPRNFEERKERFGDQIFGYLSLFDTVRPNRETNALDYCDPIFEKVKYLVWATVYTWHADTKNEYNRFGKLKDRSIRITIYSEPVQGFKNLFEGSHMFDYLVLSGRLVIPGLFRGDQNMIQADRMINDLCAEFQDKVFFKGMKETFDSFDRGASGMFNEVKVLCLETCGCIRVMLEDSSSYAEFLLSSDRTKMHVGGFGGTLSKIRNLVQTIIRLWEDPQNRNKFKPDEIVRPF